MLNDSFESNGKGVENVGKVDLGGFQRVPGLPSRLLVSGAIELSCIPPETFGSGRQIIAEIGFEDKKF